MLLEASTARSEPRQTLPNPAKPCHCWAKDSLSAYLLRACQAQARFPGMPPVHCCTTVFPLNLSNPHVDHGSISSARQAPSSNLFFHAGTFGSAVFALLSSPSAHPRLRKPNVSPFLLHPPQRATVYPPCPTSRFATPPPPQNLVPGEQKATLSALVCPEEKSRYGKLLTLRTKTPRPAIGPWLITNLEPPNCNHVWS